MVSQRSSSALPPCSRHWFVAWLCVASLLVLPAVTLGNLQCFFCPLQPSGKPCPNISTECLPHQRCSSSRGYYGAAHILSAQGCVHRDLCGSEEGRVYRGVEFKVKYRCCCRDKCNHALKSDGRLEKILGVILNKTLEEEVWASCENYTTTTTTTTSPPTAS